MYVRQFCQLPVPDDIIVLYNVCLFHCTNYNGLEYMLLPRFYSEKALDKIITRISS